MAKPKQSSLGVLNANTCYPPSENGYPPQRPSHEQPKNDIVEENMRKCTSLLKEKFNIDIFEGWPRYSDGHFVTHLYRVVDDQEGNDLNEVRAVQRP